MKEKVKVQKKVVKRKRVPQGVISIVCIVFFLAAIMGMKGMELNEKKNEYSKQIERLELAKKDAEKVKKELQIQEEYMKTDEYIKEMAKEKLNLVEKGEKIFKIEE